MSRRFARSRIPYLGPCESYNPYGMSAHPNITLDPAVMGGKPCIRGIRVTVGMILGLMAAGHANSQILADYTYLTEQDLKDALAYAAWRLEEAELPLADS